MIRSVRWPLVLVIGLAAACTGSGRDSSGLVTITLNPKVTICASEAPEPNGYVTIGRECQSLPLPNTPVAIVSDGVEVWTGTTGELGHAEARLVDPGEFVLTAESPLLPGVTLRSEPHTMGGAHSFGVDFLSEHSYILDPLF